MSQACAATPKMPHIRGLTGVFHSSMSCTPTHLPSDHASSSLLDRKPTLPPNGGSERPIHLFTIKDQYETKPGFKPRLA